QLEKDRGFRGRGVIFITFRVQFYGEPSMHRCQCLECAYIYDPAKGDPTQKIPPGTPFEKLPPTWRCPECKISIQKHGVFKRLDD
ncbi:MAG TPA: rubredoxin, partial [Thermodesulfovibrionales bacterium]|nr:rubredoxin [Thermodesulfovibrionales bacterium]